MRIPFLLLVSLFFVQPVVVCSNDLPTVGNYEALVVMHIDGLDDDALARLATQVGREREVSIEYSCVWSGIVVLKFAEADVSERADVISLARRQLAGAGIDGPVEFLHVHAEAKGPGKC